MKHSGLGIIGFLMGFVLLINLLITKVFVWLVNDLFHANLNYWIMYVLITILLFVVIRPRK
jgi:hypothetical protein